MRSRPSAWEKLWIKLFSGLGRLRPCWTFHVWIFFLRWRNILEERKSLCDSTAACDEAKWWWVSSAHRSLTGRVSVGGGVSETLLLHLQLISSSWNLVCPWFVITVCFLQFHNRLRLKALLAACLACINTQSDLIRRRGNLRHHRWFTALIICRSEIRPDF